MSGDDERDGLTSGWGGESRQDWWGWQREWGWWQADAEVNRDGTGDNTVTTVIKHYIHVPL